MVAPTGNCVRAAWSSALEGRSAVADITLFDASELPVRIAAEVRNFDAAPILGAKEARQSSRFVQFSVAAVQEALDDCGLDTTYNSDRYGCFIGVGLGAFGDIESSAHVFRDGGPRRVSPLLLPYSIPNMAAGMAAQRARLRGPSLCTASACASGAHAIGEAFLHLRAGMADVMFAGGAEAAISPMSVSAFARMKALSTRNDAPEKASRPFDLHRDGFIMGEGCGVLVLEEYEHALRRRAKIYAELTGYGLSADAHHFTQPHPEGDGIARAMAGAIKMSGIDVAEVDYVNAHGTSTHANDVAESTAIETVFAEHARQLSVSSTKGATGHCLGAAGAIEAIYTVLAVRDGIVPPTTNYETPDPQCRLDYTPKSARKRRLRYALSNSCGFGGQNACIAFRDFGSPA